MFGLFGPSPVEKLIAFVIDWLILAVGVWVAAELLDGIHLEGTKSILIVAVILGLLNALIRPILSTLALPLTVFTFGLFSIVINAALLLLTARIAVELSELTFSIDSFWVALLGAIIIALVTLIVGMVVDSRRIARDVAPRRSLRLW